MRWDPQQYRRFAGERSRPFADLLARVAASAPRRVVDLGCGSGELTAALAQRWPTADVEGVDSSPDMIAAAPRGSRLAFRLGDVREWTMPADADVVVSNATLQWVPEHRALLARWAAALPAGGWLAVQVPGNFAAPTHALLREVAGSPSWSAALAGVLRSHDSVGEPAEYAELLLGAGLVADVWETTYVHVLTGDDAVLEWLRGTGLRPVMAALPPAAYRRFEAELAGRLRAAYPPGPHGTLLPFRRIFFVGHRPSFGDQQG
jgi:trans-aconitate 2-methyltransferase